MRLLFWTSRRLVPLYVALLVGTLIVWGVAWALGRLHAPAWAASVAIIIWGVLCVAASIRAIVLQARDNARPTGDWLDRPHKRGGRE